MVEFVQLTTECCWGQPSDPCQRGCLTSHACVMWGPRTLNADDDDDDEQHDVYSFISCCTAYHPLDQLPMPPHYEFNYYV